RDVLVGCAITVGYLLMPAALTLNSPSSFGLMTSVYAGFMTLFAALAAGSSIELGLPTGLGWKGSRGIWAVLGAAAFLAWLPQVIRKRDARAVSGSPMPRRSLWRSSRLAWQIRSEEHTSELQSRENLVCRPLLEKKNDKSE